MSPVTNLLSQVIERARANTGGEIANYIPELAKVDPEAFGLAVTSVLGSTYSAGDSDVLFTMQSISKPFVYALAVSDIGVAEIERHVGFEPSGEPFNAISLEPVSGRPANPLINAGAIVSTSLVQGANPDERFERIRSKLSQFAGRDLDVDEAVYCSEVATGDRNRALAYLAASTGVLLGDAEDAANVYFRQCSLRATVTDLALMAATLAHGGINPVTHEQVVSEEVATLVISVMAMTGMYNDSGEWMVRVGLPAKSGVGGGIVAVYPGQFGIGVFSPPLDEKGNSVRGVAALEQMSSDFRLHMLAHPREPRSPIVRAGVVDGTYVVELRGEVDFIAAEQIAARLRAAAPEIEAVGGHVVFDLSGVTRIRRVAETLIAQVVEGFDQESYTVDFVDPKGVAPDSLG